MGTGLEKFHSHASKVMVKILQVRLQQYENRELPNVQARFRKGRGPEIKLPILVVSWGKQGHSKRISISASLTTLKPLIVWITSWKFLQQMGVPDHITCLLRKLYMIKKQKLQPEIEQLGKE